MILGMPIPPNHPSFVDKISASMIVFYGGTRKRFDKFSNRSVLFLILIISNSKKFEFKYMKWQQVQPTIIVKISI